MRLGNGPAASENTVPLKECRHRSAKIGLNASSSNYKKLGLHLGTYATTYSYSVLLRHLVRTLSAS